MEWPSSAAQGIRPTDYPFAVKPYPELVKLFEYKHGDPVNAKLGPLLTKGGIQIFEINYDDPLGGKPIAGYVIENGRKSKQPAVVYIHSAGRNAFLPEAIFLARLGAITMPLGSTMIKPPGQMQHTVVALRRAFDYLASRPCQEAIRKCAAKSSKTPSSSSGKR